MRHTRLTAWLRLIRPRLTLAGWLSLGPSVFLVLFGGVVLLEAHPSIHIGMSMLHTVEWPLLYLIHPVNGAIFLILGSAWLAETLLYVRRPSLRLVIWIGGLLAVWNLMLYAALSSIDPPRPTTFLAAMCGLVLPVTVYFWTHLIAKDG